MIRRIVLRNWKSHEETELEFGKGTNILVGIMGAGKSAVLDAISFALFGKFPRQREVRLSDVIMSRPSEKPQAEVELEFEADGKDYSVKRTIRRKGAPEAELRIDGKLLMSEPEKVTELIEDALKVNYDVFCRAIYSEQNRLDNFLLLAPKERKRQMDELLGLDRFANARDSLTTLVNRLSGIRAESGERLRVMKPEELRRSNEQAKKAVSEAEAKKKNAAEAIAKAREGTAVAEKELQGLERLKREFDAERERKLSLEGQLAGLEGEAKAKETACRGKLSAAAVEGELRKASDMLSSAEAERKRLEREVSAKSKEAGELGALAREAQRNSERKALLEKRLRELEGVEGNLAKVAERIAGVEHAGVEAKAREAELVRRSSELEVAIGELSKGAGRCPVCDSQLEEAKRQKLVSEKRVMLEEAKRGVEAAERDVEKAKAEKERLAPILAEMGPCAQRIAELSANLEAAKGAKEKADAVMNELKEIEGKKEVMEREISSFSKRAEALRADEAAWRELERLRKRIGEATEGIVRASTRLASIRFNEELYSQRRKAAEDARSSTAKLEGEAQTAEVELRAAEERRAFAETALHDVEKLQSGIAEASAACEKMAKVQSAVTETQMALRGELSEAINETIADIWPIIYPYRDYAGARLVPSEGDYAVELKAGADWLPIEAVASGGERTCAALALRMAFAMVLVPNLKWLVLDEPTHNLDEQGIRALVEVLRERLPEIVEQVFVITHDETLKDAASARLYRFDRNKEIWEPTRAMALA